jgi:RES domain-containing protein
MDRMQRYAGPAAVAKSGSEAWSAEALITHDGNRWSGPGEPTVYLGSEPAVALAELVRHLPAEGSPAGVEVWSVDIDVDSIVDIRTATRIPGVAIGARRHWVLDRSRCRRVARALRERGCKGIIVPSVAFLDQPDRWNLVLFAETLGKPLDQLIVNPRRVTRTVAP